MTIEPLFINLPWDDQPINVLHYMRVDAYAGRHYGIYVKNPRFTNFFRKLFGRKLVKPYRKYDEFGYWSRPKVVIAFSGGGERIFRCKSNKEALEKRDYIIGVIQQYAIDS